MYLDLCGSLEKIDDEVYIGKFRPSMYKTDTDEEQIPLFIIIEAMTQAVCRACSKEFFDGVPAFPSQVSNLFITENISDKCTFENSKLLLKASVSKKGNMGTGQCDLIEENGKVLISGCIWAAKRIVAN